MFCATLMSNNGLDRRDRYQMTKYLFIGDGRLSRHFTHYFRALHLDVTTWSRKSQVDLEPLINSADRILLLISDDEIKQFVEQHPFLLKKRLIHCSGSLTFSFAEGAHPLNTFGKDLYPLEIYLKTPFITEKNGSSFSDLLPDLPNPHFALPKEKKSLYHSLCVMSGNFTTLLWQNVFETFENELHLPKEVLYSFLEQTAHNLRVSPEAALTGPIARGDTSTLIRNLDSLSGRPEQQLYYAFLNFVLEKKKKIGDLQYERLGL